MPSRRRGAAAVAGSVFLTLKVARTSSGRTSTLSRSTSARATPTTARRAGFVVGLPFASSGIRSSTNVSVGGRSPRAARAAARAKAARTKACRRQIQTMLSRGCCATLLVVVTGVGAMASSVLRRHASTAWTCGWQTRTRTSHVVRTTRSVVSSSPTSMSHRSTARPRSRSSESAANASSGNDTSRSASQSARSSSVE